MHTFGRRFDVMTTSHNLAWPIAFLQIFKNASTILKRLKSEFPSWCKNNDITSNQVRAPLRHLCQKISYFYRFDSSFGPEYIAQATVCQWLELKQLLLLNSCKIDFKPSLKDMVAFSSLMLTACSAFEFHQKSKSYMKIIWPSPKYLINFLQSAQCLMKSVLCEWQ